jgi:bacteriocin-like protein
MIKVNDKELNKVVGGVIFDARNISGADPDRPFEILDNYNGNCLGRYPTKEAAIIEAVRRWGGKNERDIQEVDVYEVMRMRGGHL